MCPGSNLKKKEEEEKEEEKEEEEERIILPLEKVSDLLK